MYARDVHVMERALLSYGTFRIYSRGLCIAHLPVTPLSFHVYFENLSKTWGRGKRRGSSPESASRLSKHAEPIQIFFFHFLADVISASAQRDFCVSTDPHK